MLRFSPFAVSALIHAAVLVGAAAWWISAGQALRPAPLVLKFGVRPGLAAPQVAPPSTQSPAKPHRTPPRADSGAGEPPASEGEPVVPDSIPEEEGPSPPPVPDSVSEKPAAQGRGTPTESPFAERTVVPARLISGGDPVYPPRLRRAGIQGTVLVQVELGEDGSVLRASPVVPSPWPEMDRAAVEATRHAVYAPRRVGTTAQSSILDIPVRFILQ